MSQQHARQYSFAEAQWKRIEDLLPTELVTRNCLKRGAQIWCRLGPVENFLLETVLKP